MFPRILREEAERLSLEFPEGPAVAGMEIHFRLLRKWNHRLNLTAVRDERAIARRHFLEAIQASPHLSPSGPLLDLGSGNGFPGVPIKLLNPRISLTVVDSSERKCSFLKELFRALEWDVSGVVCRRVNEPADLQGLGKFRSIVMRGVKPKGKLLRVLLDGLEPEGTLMVFLGKGQIDPVRVALGDAATLDPVPMAGPQATFLGIIRPQNVPRGAH